MAQIRFNARHGLTVGSTPINIVDGLGNATLANVTGTWIGALVAGQYGGTGVNNTGKTITLGGNLITSGAFAVTLTVTAATNVTLPTTGTLATTGNLSQFASTTSAQLAGLISDETGTGLVVFGTSPSINTATLIGSVDLSALTLNGGTIIAASKPVLDAAQTWNGSGITFTGFKLNITNTSSSATSALMALQVAGVSRFSVSVAGDVTSTSYIGSGSGLTGTAPGLTVGNVTTNANLTGDATSVGNASTVVRINGISLAGLATGILKNTTTTGAPSIAINSDLPVMSATVGGAVPTPPNNTTTFLRGDGTFAVLPAVEVTPAFVQAQTFVAFTTGGTATAYTLTPSPAITAYAAGQSFFVTFNAASGSNPTLTISGLATPPNLVKQNGDGTYVNIAPGNITLNHRSSVTLISATQALVENLPAASSAGATGTGTDQSFNENDNLVTTSYTLGAKQLTSGAIITIASPAVVTLAAHGWIATQPIFFQTTGALPTPLLVNTAYFVIATGLTANNFQISLTSGGAAIVTSGTQSGLHSVGKIKNASTAGPVTIADGATVVIPTGSTWSVI